MRAARLIAAAETRRLAISFIPRGSSPHVSNPLMHRDNNNSDRPGAMSEWARALFDGIDDAVFVHDDQGRIREANPAACRRLGYTRDEFLRLTTRDIDAPDFAVGFADRF